MRKTAKKECFFIFKSEEKLEDCTYLTKEKTWSEHLQDAELMSEQQASDTCCDYADNGACGSIIVEIEL